MAVDSRGRITARLDLPRDAMVADIGLGRIATVYGMAGDLFSWLCVLGLPLWILLGRTSRRAQPTEG